MMGVRKFVDELHYLGTPDRRRRVEARDAELTQEVVEKCVKAYVAFVDARESWDNREPVDAIRAVATPPELPRERLGRVAYESIHGDLWDCATEKTKNWYCDSAAAVIAEQARIDAEGKP